MEYVFILTLLIVLVYKYDYKKCTEHKWFWYYLIMIALTCLAGFRYKIGIDSIRYEAYFNTVQDTLSNISLLNLNIFRYEPLYELFSALCKSIIDEFWFLQLMQATLVNVVIFYFFRRYTENVFIAVTLYTLACFLDFTMETMRAGCAIATMLLGYDQFKRNNRLFSILFFILSFLFHYESVILIPLFFYLLFFDNKISIGKWFWIVALLLVGLSPFIQSFFNQYVYYFAITDRMSDSIEAYGSNGFFDSRLNIGGIISSFALVILVPLFSIYSIKQNQRYYPHEAIVLWSIFIIVISLDISIFYRYRAYFYPFIILLLADSFGLSKFYIRSKRYINSSSFLIKSFFILLPIFCTSVLSQFRLDSEAHVACYWEYYPYTSIFNPQDFKERDAIYNAHIVSY